MKGITRVVHERERKKRRREGWDEIRGWSAEARLWVGVLGAIGLAGLAATFWKSLAKWLGW